MIQPARASHPHSPRIRRHAWLGALCAFAFISCGGGEADSSETSGKKRPNVILITLDTVRADYLTCYGATSGGTPSIDQLADGGALFERAVSSSGLTPASHATILTGKFQYNHGVRVLTADSGFYLDSEHATLATEFKEAGYTTGAVHSAFPVSAHFGFDRGFDHFDSFDAKLTEAKDGSKVRWDVGKFQRRSDETTMKTLAWLKEAKAADQPFFLWIHYWDPHDPVMLPPAGELEGLMATSELQDIADRQTREYAAEVRWQDQHIGTLLNSLKVQGIMDDTVIAVTADHGQGLADGMELHRWANHRMLYREQVHVPLLLKGPGVPAGVRITDQVRTADVAPTLLELAGVPAIEGRIDGESLVSRLQGDAPGDLWAYGEQINGYDFNAAMRKHRPDATFLYMVSDGEWKLVYKPTMFGASELFHVAIDPKETRNVIADNNDQVVRLLGNLADRNPWVTEPFPRTTLTDEQAAAGAGDAMAGLGYSATDKGTGDWKWFCPEHRGTPVDQRGRCQEVGCGKIMVPIGVWKDAPPK